MPATNQTIIVNRLKPLASLFIRNIQDLICLMIKLDTWPKAFGAVGLTEKQVIRGSGEGIPCK